MENKKLTVKCYNSNALISQGQDSIVVHYDGDYCNGFTTEEYMETIKEEVLENFEDVDPENLEAVLHTISIHVQGFCE